MRKLSAVLLCTALMLPMPGWTEDSGVLRGSPDDGTTKNILKTKPDGTLLMDIPKLSTGATGALRMELVNETDPQVGDGLPANAVPRGDTTAGALLSGNVFDTGANVGIGTTAPGQRLEVVGTVKATASISREEASSASGRRPRKRNWKYAMKSRPTRIIGC